VFRHGAHDGLPAEPARQVGRADAGGTETTSGSPRCGRAASQASRMNCGLTASTSAPASPSAASGAVAARMPNCCRNCAQRAASISTTTIPAAGGRRAAGRRFSAAAMLPPPMKAIFM